MGKTENVEPSTVDEVIFFYREERRAEGTLAPEWKHEESVLDVQLLGEHYIDPLSHDYSYINLGPVHRDDLVCLAHDRALCEHYSACIGSEAFLADLETDLEAGLRLRVLFITHRPGETSFTRSSGIEVSLITDAYFLDPDTNRILSAYQFGKLSPSRITWSLRVERELYPRFFYRDVFVRQDQLGRTAGLIAAGIFLFAENQFATC